jgi:hypothetical protein
MQLTGISQFPDTYRKGIEDRVSQADSEVVIGHFHSDM